MPRTISLDNVQIARIILVREPDGVLHIHAEYNLRSGNQTIRPVTQDLTARLSGARRAAVQSVFDGLAQDVSAIELA